MCAPSAAFIISPIKDSTDFHSLDSVVCINVNGRESKTRYGKIGKWMKKIRRSRNWVCGRISIEKNWTGSGWTKKSETIRRNFRGLRRRIRNTQSSFLDGTKIMQGNIEGIRARNENWATSRESFVFKFSYGYNNYRLLMIGRIVEVQGNFSSSCFFVHFFSVRNGKIGKNFP